MEEFKKIKKTGDLRYQNKMKSSPIKPLKDGSFWGICLGHTFTHWYSASFFILLPYITLEFDLSVAQAGSLVTIMFVAKALTGMPIGAITDMTTRKSVMMAMSLFLSGLPFLFMGMTDTFWILVILVIVMGIGNEMWHPASFSSLSVRFPKQRGFVFGFHGMAANLGDLLAPTIIGALISVIVWRQVVYWNVLPGIIVSIIILFLLRKLQDDNSNSFKNNQTDKKQDNNSMNVAIYVQGFKELFKNRTVLLLALASGFRAMAQNGLLTFLPLYLAFEMHLSPLWVGVYVSILQAGGLLSAPIVGAASDKLGGRKIVYSGMIFTSVAVISMTLVQINWLLVPTIAILGFFLYSLRPVMQAWAMESTSQEMAGTTTSLMFTAQSIMASSSPLIGGILADQYGFLATFYFIAIVILVGNLVVFLIPREDKKA